MEPIALRQSRVEKILATDWVTDTNPEPADIRQMIENIYSRDFITNAPPLCALLVPKQIITAKSRKI